MPEAIRRVRPTYTEVYLANPHKGCCTFQHFNGDPLFPGTSWSEEGPTAFDTTDSGADGRSLSQRTTTWGRYPGVVPGYLPSTVAYCRWFWSLLEPEQGCYDFSMIDKAFAKAHRHGQTVAVRLMAFGSATQPRVPEWYAQAYPMQDRTHKSLAVQEPVLDAPEYLEHWGGLIREFAHRYDDHPLLESIDVTFIGPWGEGAGECSEEQINRFAELWQQAFTRTPRLALIAGSQMAASVRRGSGWRCDCFGDLGMNRGGGSPTVTKPASWQHMYDCYPRQVVLRGANDAWKTAPVHFETCGVPMHWYFNRFDIDFILQQGLKYHGTYFMPKSAALPEPWMDKIESFCRQLGYRFALRQAVIPAHLAPTHAMPIQLWIENVGVAPIYQRYDLALRFRQDSKELFTVLDGEDIRAWLPGDVWIERDVAVPDGLRSGWVELSAGLVDKEMTARVSFAAKEVFSDRWLDLCGFELVR